MHIRTFSGLDYEPSFVDYLNTPQQTFLCGRWGILVLCTMPILRLLSLPHKIKTRRPFAAGIKPAPLIGKAAEPYLVEYVGIEPTCIFSVQARRPLQADPYPKFSRILSPLSSLIRPTFSSHLFNGNLVEVTRIELATSCLQNRRSPK